MLKRLTEFFILSQRYRSTNKVMIRRAILEKGMPDLLAKVGNPTLRAAIIKFVRENTDEQSTGTTGS